MRIAVCLFALLALASCSSDADGGIEAEEGKGSYTIDEQTGETTVRVTTEDGEAVVRSGKNVPLDLPYGFTLYRGAKVVSHTRFTQGEERGSLLLIESDDAAAMLVQFYRNQAERAGIAITLELSTNAGEMIAGKGKAGEHFSFNANTVDGKTTAQLTLGQEL